MERVTKVTIYIATSTKKIKVVEKGYYAAIIECKTKKGLEETDIEGFEKDTTYNRLVLQAIICALCELKWPCKVTIHTDCAFVRNMINHERPEQWKRSEWIKSGGGSVKYKDLWQQYLEMKGSHGITAKPNNYEGLQGYLKKMDELMEKLTNSNER